MTSEKSKEPLGVSSIKTGEFLAALRKAAGYTQQEVADYLNLTNKTISKWESGNGLPEIGILPTVAALYGVSVDEILAGRRLEKEESTTQKSGNIIEKHSKWLMTTSKRFYTNALAALWVATLAGLTLFWGLYYGLQNSWRWVLIPYGAIWLLAEGLGVFLCFRTLSYKSSSLQAECPDMESTCKKTLYRQGMGLTFPLVFAILSLLPIFLFKPYEKAMVDEIFFYMDPLKRNMAFGNLRLNGQGFFLYSLPCAALLSSFIWGSLYFLLQPVLLKEKTARLGIIIAVIGVLFFGIITIAGQQYQHIRNEETVVYEDEQDFNRYVNIYLKLYESYRAYGEQPEVIYSEGTSIEKERPLWPDVTIDSKTIDHTYLDTELLTRNQHPEYQGVIGIDKDNLTIHRKVTVEEQLATITRWNSYRALACSAALMALWWWFVYTKKKLA